MSKFKDFLRKNLPVRGSVFAAYKKEVTNRIKAVRAEQHQQSDSLADIEEKLSSIMAEINKVQAALSEIQAGQSASTDGLEMLNERLMNVEETLKKDLTASGTTLSRLPQIVDNQRRLQDLLRRNIGISQDAVWANIFNSTIAGSEWFRDVPVSPGRWAVGYQYLFVLYRILNIVQPKSILEIGLGQSTVMLSSYVASHKGAEHTVVEHDEDWIAFFKKENNPPEGTSIDRLELDYVDFADSSHKVRVYAGFEERYGDRKFDLISVDGPLGGDMTDYARIDILSIVPDCLADSFIILIDDSNRTGEAGTINKLKTLLENAGIEYKQGVYRGEKSTTVIASCDYAFVCSM